MSNSKELKKRYDKRYENDSTQSTDVAKAYRKDVHKEHRSSSLALIHYRGSEEEFLLGSKYCFSHDAGDRATGADILAQLGWSDHTFHNESVEILIRLLIDPDIYVVYCAAVALGHRSDKKAISELLPLVQHPDPLVRYGVVFGLSGHEDDRAISALVKLSSDNDHDVRNWAIFGLGTQIEADSFEIRQALRQALDDADHEVRGEALVGLAKRKDKSIIPELLDEWINDDISILSLEAAEMTADPSLFHRLNHFTEILILDDDPSFAKQLAEAIAACSPNTI